MNSKTCNYFAYTIVYFVINLINMYLIVYFPLYFFTVLNVDKQELALTQFISNIMLIFAIILGFLFDRYIRKKKFIISISACILFISFLLFILFREILFWFGIFLSLNLLMKTIIQTAMSKLMFELVNSNESLKKNVVMISNISSSIGAIIPSVLFTIIIHDFYSMSHWNTFLLFGWIISLPILFTSFFIKEETHLTMMEKNDNSYNFEFEKYEGNKSKFVLMLLIYISYFLFWSSQLFGYPLSSWIATSFGESAFKLYSTFYIIFFLVNLSGFYAAKKLSRKTSEKKIISIGVLCIVFLFLMFPFVDFPLFILLYALDAFIYGIIVSNFLYLIIDISRTGKYENLKYQVMQSSSHIGNAIFTSLGIYLSSFFSTSLLMIISAILVLAALFPLLFKRYFKDISY